MTSQTMLAGMNFSITGTSNSHGSQPCTIPDDSAWKKFSFSLRHMTLSQVNVKKGAEQAPYMASSSAITESVSNNLWKTVFLLKVLWPVLITRHHGRKEDKMVQHEIFLTMFTMKKCMMNHRKNAAFLFSFLEWWCFRESVPSVQYYISQGIYFCTYSLLPNFVEWFLANILVTKCRSHMGFSALDSESKLWHLFFLHLMTFLVTLTFDFALSLEMSSCLEPLAYILATTKMKTWKHENTAYSGPGHFTLGSLAMFQMITFQMQ